MYIILLRPFNRNMNTVDRLTNAKRYIDLYEFIQKFKKKGRQLIMVSSVSSLTVTILLFYKQLCIRMHVTADDYFVIGV